MANNTMQNWTETLNAADGEEGEFKESINRMRGLEQFANKGLSPSESTEVPHNFHNPCCIMRDRVIHLVSFQFTAPLIGGIRELWLQQRLYGPGPHSMCGYASVSVFRLRLGLCECVV